MTVCTFISSLQQGILKNLVDKRGECGPLTDIVCSPRRERWEWEQKKVPRQTGVLRRKNKHKYESNVGADWKFETTNIRRLSTLHV